MVQCIDKSYACSQCEWQRASIQFLQKRVCVFTQAMLAVNVKTNSALIAFPKEKNFISVQNPAYVRTIRLRIFSFLGTYVHTFFTWNEKFYAALLLYETLIST